MRAVTASSPGDGFFASRQGGTAGIEPGDVRASKTWRLDDVDREQARRHGQRPNEEARVTQRSGSST